MEDTFEVPGGATTCDLILVREHTGEEWKVTLQSGAVLRVGRAENNDLPLDFDGVSAYHAELFLRYLRGQQYVCIRDNSKNGTGIRPGPKSKKRGSWKKGVPPQWAPVPRGEYYALPNGWQMVMPLRNRKNGSQGQISTQTVTLYVGDIVTDSLPDDIDGEEWEPGDTGAGQVPEAPPPPPDLGGKAFEQPPLPPPAAPPPAVPAIPTPLQAVAPSPFSPFGLALMPGQMPGTPLLQPLGAMPFGMPSAMLSSMGPPTPMTPQVHVSQPVTAWPKSHAYALKAQGGNSIAFAPQTPVPGQIMGVPPPPPAPITPSGMLAAPMQVRAGSAAAPGTPILQPTTTGTEPVPLGYAQPHAVEDHLSARNRWMAALAQPVPSTPTQRKVLLLPAALAANSSAASNGKVTAGKEGKPKAKQKAGKMSSARRLLERTKGKKWPDKDSSGSERQRCESSASDAKSSSRERPKVTAKKKKKKTKAKKRKRKDDSEAKSSNDSDRQRSRTKSESKDESDSSAEVARKRRRKRTELRERKAERERVRRQAERKRTRKERKGREKRKAKRRRRSSSKSATEDEVSSASEKKARVSPSHSGASKTRDGSRSPSSKAKKVPSEIASNDGSKTDAGEEESEAQDVRSKVGSKKDAGEEEPQAPAGEEKQQAPEGTAAVAQFVVDLNEDD